MKRFAIFNPEHDLALANGDAHYLAPHNIREMARDLAPLMGYIGWDAPWGWDAAIVDRLCKSGIPRQQLPSDEMLAALRARSGRITSHHLLSTFRREHPADAYIGESLIVRSTDEIEAYALQYGHVLLKAPLSGSGKGLRHVNLNDNDNVNADAKGASVLERVERFALTTTEALALQRSTACSPFPSGRQSTSTSSLKKVESWATTLIRRHGYLTAEPFYNKVVDFAMEFCVTDRQCSFIGYSLFTTDTHGRYDSSLLLSDADIEAHLSNYVPRKALHTVCHFVQTHVDLIVPREWDTSRFPITFGIDMMIIDDGQRAANSVSEFKLHPCVEINLRCNMGIVAHEVRRHLMAPEATGIYRLAIFADHAALTAFDEEQRALYPALYRDGLLIQGYRPLTSTENGARHLAYIIGTTTP